MTARELIALLQSADPDSTVLFLDDYADLSESDELFDVIIPAEPWTHERGKYGGNGCSVHYPEAFEPRDAKYSEAIHEAQRVVLHMNGETNFRRMGLAERRKG